MEEEGAEYQVFPLPPFRYAEDNSVTAVAAPPATPTPIVIDCGSFHCRAGWASAAEPQLDFRSEVRKLKKPTKQQSAHVGWNLTEDALRLSSRSPFDHGVMFNPDILEEVLSWTFYRLGLQGQPSVAHPLLYTEPYCNPNYSRRHTSELLFECYGVPSVSYAVDALCSFRHNATLAPHRRSDRAFVVSAQHHATYLLPLLDGRPDARHACRIDVGGETVAELLQGVLKMKYPEHRPALSGVLMEGIKEHHSYVPVNYDEELESFLPFSADVGKLTRAIQLPLPKRAAPPAPPTTAELEKRANDRRDQVRRLHEVQRLQRLAKLEVDERALSAIADVVAQQQINKKSFKAELEARGLRDLKAAQKELKLLAISVVRTKERDGIADEERPVDEALVRKENSQLTPAKLRQKQHSIASLLKNEAKAKAREVYRHQKARRQEQKEREKRRRQEDPEAWLQELRQQREELLQREEKRQLDKSVWNSRRSASTQNRLKLLNVAADSKAADDDFGANDGDWDVYLEMAVEGGGATGSAKDRAALQRVEKLLTKHDPEYMLRATEGPSLEVQHQIFLGVERIRPSQCIFQPSIVGNDQMGVREAFATTLAHYDAATQEELVKNIFVTGGVSRTKGFLPRLQAELQSIRPTSSVVNVWQARDPSLDAWHGGRQWALGEHFAASSVTRAQYDEEGAAYLVEHELGNAFLQPLSQ